MISIKLVNVGAPNLWGHYKDGTLKASDEVCWRKRDIKEIHGGGMKM